MALSLEEEFESRGLRRGGVLFLRPPDALDMVWKARQRSLRVLGLDAFRLSAEATEPVMEHSIDFTLPSQADRNPSDTWAAAEEFLNQRLKSDLYFEVVTEAG